MDIRDELIDALKQEIIGPSPNPEYLEDVNGEPQEVLLQRVHGSPFSRYGAGVLHPKKIRNTEVLDSGEDIFINDDDPLLGQGSALNNNDRNSEFNERDNAEEEPVGLANQFLPSAMGFTVMFNSQETEDTVSIQIKSACYKKGTGEKLVKKYSKDDKGAIIAQNHDKINKTSPYWVRHPLDITPIELYLHKIFINKNKSYSQVIYKTDDDRPWLTLNIFDRTTSKDIEDNRVVFTFVIINTIEATDSPHDNQYVLFQNKISIEVSNPNIILPYRERQVSTDTEEEQEMNLLYRKKRLYAIGHGGSVEWNGVYDETAKREIVTKIQTALVPVYEMPQIAPTAHVELSMFELSDMGEWSNAVQSLQELVSKYEKWVDSIETDAKSDDLKPYGEAALRNAEKCRTSLERMRQGVEILINTNEDNDIVRCFRWMNRAMIWQQQRSKTNQRKWIQKNNNLTLERINENGEETFSDLSTYHIESKYNGRWRPFQLAFIIMNLDAIINAECSEDRDTVDLIWFPTGGGKTEAYLGLAAFTIFYRRLCGSSRNNLSDYGGTSVLMRYTLRLLTTQQYERAASLICACDLIRQDNIFDLGEEPISIGLWVGMSSTPNSCDEARTQYNKLTRERSADYNFIVMKCPCCSAQIGRIARRNGRNATYELKGIKKEDGKNGNVIFSCDNSSCEYHNKRLPLYVVDEDIYSISPTLIIGTVDKFAMIPWKIKAGALFGFRESDVNGVYRINPPELIIQDELHLISGPLGTMVGLYETLVQTLCNNYNRRTPPFIENIKSFIPPKIVASSATISRAGEQVKSLYATDKLSIFPAQGLSFGDTWFSEEKDTKETNENSNEIKWPGRKYVGILASGYPSAQTAIVRSYSSVLQAVKQKENEGNIDYYWTLLGYFNSIRELGGASSLVYGDIRERLNQIQNRELIPFDNWRKLYDGNIQELTSRIPSSQIPVVLKKLEEKFMLIKNKALDICLATNMIATGLDVPRLGLMFIHGQPKTTAEYIQASSRVGRNPPTGPGLIFTLYSPSKPRDKSQYEQFQSYHSRIYSKVEPTSVTPFSVNARERGLHAILIALMRHFSGTLLRERPIIENTDFNSLLEPIANIILERCRTVDPSEYDNTKELLNKRIVFWQKRGVEYYGDAMNQTLRNNNYPLMYSTGSEAPEDVINYSLPTPTSMRGVDFESEIKIIE